MENTINFGIDLGTTNSLIAKFVKGGVEVFKNPTGFKETLPSVVAFRKDKILVGDKAREYLEKDPKNVIGSFKRRMGTTESFRIQSLGQTKTPIELSAYVLKELKTFVHTGEGLESVVLTIPASFDTIQSNATKEAGYQAGFKQVVLLQEPIAASLAYANKHKETDLANGYWMVYDLGGGTFDVALIKIQDGEMKVLDHEGDNFLGGGDFDQAIVEHLVIPYLDQNGTFDDLARQMKSADGRYNGKWYEALHAAEEAKKELSSKTSAEMEMTISDNKNEDLEAVIPVTRSEFESLIKKEIDRSARMMQTIMTRSSLRSHDIQFVLMVGGSTYIPYVRKRIEEFLQITINCDIDPTTAVAIGAAYYAGTKVRELVDQQTTKKSQTTIKIKTAYQRTSQDNEEFFSAKIDGPIAGLSYRITREDGGFDSGLKKLANRLNEDLPLVKDTYNFFKLIVYNENNVPVDIDSEPIGIAQGKYAVVGQPLPHDICIEVDDLETGSTKLELVFQKNAILPLKSTKSKTVSRTIVKGSVDDLLKINVLEGPSYALPAANQTIGYMTISGRQMMRDVVKGSDIEITLEMSESRDLKVSAYLSMANQTFGEVFSPTALSVSVEKLQEEIQMLNQTSEEEMKKAVDREDYEVAQELDKQKKDLRELLYEANSLTPSDVTDTKYKLAERKRRAAQGIDGATQGARSAVLRKAYEEEKADCVRIVTQGGNDRERKVLNDIISQEKIFLTSNSVIKIRERIAELNQLKYIVLWRTPDFLVRAFQWLEGQRHKLNNQVEAKSLLEAGQLALEQKNVDRLAEIVNGLLQLLPDEERDKARTMMGIR